MRLIRQDGRADVPYEHVAVCLHHADSRVIVAFSPSDNHRNFLQLAVYSTEEKAMKAMEMLQETVSGNFCLLTTIFQFPKDEEIEV